MSRCTRRRAKPDADRHLAFVGRANVEKGPEVAVRVVKLLGRHLKMAVKINEPAEQDHWDEHVAPLLVGADVEVVRTSGTERGPGSIPKSRQGYTPTQIAVLLDLT